MESYIREITLYNNRFPERVEQAENEINKYKEYEKDLYDICNLFEAYFMEYVLYKKLQRNLIKETPNVCIGLSFKAKKRISFWLKKGYDKSELIKTMILTIVSWSKNENLREHISLEKIFDDKFEERFKVAKIKEVPFIKEKESTNILKNWYENQNEYKIEQKEIKKIEESPFNIIEEKELKEDNFIDVTVEQEETFVKSILKKMRIW